MKPPVILDNKGDMLAFPTLEEALSYTEVIDVEANEYEAYDSEGRLLILGTGPGGRYGNKQVVITNIEESPYHQQELRARLLRFMRRVGVPIDEGAELAVLVGEFATLIQRWRQRPGNGKP